MFELFFYLFLLLLSREEGVLGHRLGPPRSIDSGVQTPRVIASVVARIPTTSSLVQLSVNHVATEVHASKCGERQSAFSQVRRDATAAKATPPTHTREGQALGGDIRPALSGFLLENLCNFQVCLTVFWLLPRFSESGIEPRMFVQLL